MAVEYRDCHPYWYYRNVELADRGGGASLGEQTIVFRIKSGFNYLIRGMMIAFPHIDAATDDVPPIPRLTLIQYERNRAITETPIPVELLSNPGGSEPPPPGHVQHARPIHNGFIRWDYLVSNSDVIYIRISGMAGGAPANIRLMVMGHNIKANANA